MSAQPQTIGGFSWGEGGPQGRRGEAYGGVGVFWAWFFFLFKLTTLVIGRGHRPLCASKFHTAFDITFAAGSAV